MTTGASLIACDAASQARENIMELDRLKRRAKILAECQSAALTQEEFDKERNNLGARFTQVCWNHEILRSQDTYDAQRKDRDPTVDFCAAYYETRFFKTLDAMNSFKDSRSPWRFSRVSILRAAPDADPPPAASTAWIDLSQAAVEQAEHQDALGREAAIIAAVWREQAPPDEQFNRESIRLREEMLALQIWRKNAANTLSQLQKPPNRPSPRQEALTKTALKHFDRRSRKAAKAVEEAAHFRDSWWTKVKHWFHRGSPASRTPSNTPSATPATHSRAGEENLLWV